MELQPEAVIACSGPGPWNRAPPAEITQGGHYAEPERKIKEIILKKVAPCLHQDETRYIVIGQISEKNRRN